MSEIKLGELAGENAKRDAVHFALAPVVAACEIKPGDHIGLDSAGRASIYETAIGIADPFLVHNIEPGQSFYLVLYPNTVTGMRHHWEHPSFKNDQDGVKRGDVAASEAWLRDYIANADCPSYEEVMAAVCGLELSNPDPEYYTVAYENNGEYLHFNGRDAHGNIPDEFWDHVEVVTGQRMNRRARHWSCSC